MARQWNGSSTTDGTSNGDSDHDSAAKKEFAIRVSPKVKMYNCDVSIPSDEHELKALLSTVIRTVRLA